MTVVEHAIAELACYVIDSGGSVILRTGDFGA